MAHTQTDARIPALTAALPRDPLGLLAGWRAFRTYEALRRLSDGALAARGLTRRDLPQVALTHLRRAL